MAPIVDLLINLIYIQVMKEDLTNTLSQQRNYLKHPTFRDKLYRKDDNTIRFFRSYIKDGFKENGLANSPEFEEDTSCRQCGCL